nr:MAG TPA: hypothetical protein [Caudoviricetes sp.]
MPSRARLHAYFSSHSTMYSQNWSAVISAFIVT